MAGKKKKEPTFELPPLKSYRSVNNRYLVLDWASMSYHKMFSINTAKNREKYEPWAPKAKSSCGALSWSMN